MLFAFLLWRQPAGPAGVRRWIVLFLVGFAATAAFGGTSHGFFPDHDSTGYAVVWRATLAALGFAAMAGWGLGTALALPGHWLRPITAIAGIEYAVYLGVILVISQEYLVGVLNYVPAAFFVLVAFCWLFYRQRSAAARHGVVALVLTFTAAGVQTAGVSLHPVYLDHNVLYHLIQGVGIVFLYLAGRGLDPVAA